MEADPPILAVAEARVGGGNMTPSGKLSKPGAGDGDSRAWGDGRGKEPVLKPGMLGDVSERSWKAGQIPLI